MDDDGSMARRSPGLPDVRPATVSDIRAALAGGFADFSRAPLYGLFFGGVIAVGGLLLIGFLTRWNMPWMVYPMVMGFPLVGPFIAVGLYEVSRRLEAGEPLTWSGVLGVVFAQRGRQLGWMAFVMLFVFWIWIYQVRLLLALFLGTSGGGGTLESFTATLFTTRDGLLFLAIGHVVGAVLALVLYSVTVVSIPLLMARDIDVVSAIITSFRAVAASPVVMLGWGAVVTVLFLAASIPAFLGLLVVLPVLGHATWRLAQRLVVS
jgi:uncharacterized membrane protein